MLVHAIPSKVGTCIILIKNLSIKDGHCNGTRFIILSHTRRFIQARKWQQWDFHYMDTNTIQGDRLLSAICHLSICNSLYWFHITSQYLEHKDKDLRRLACIGQKVFLLMATCMLEHPIVVNPMVDTFLLINLNLHILPLCLNNQKCFTQNVVYTEMFAYVKKYSIVHESSHQ